MWLCNAFSYTVTSLRFGRVLYEAMQFTWPAECGERQPGAGFHLRQ